MDRSALAATRNARRVSHRRFLLSTFFCNLIARERKMCANDLYDLEFHLFFLRCRKRCPPRPATRRRSTTAPFSSICPSCRRITARSAISSVWRARRSSRRRARRVRDLPRSTRARRIRTATCRCHPTIRTRDPRRDTRRARTTYPGVPRAPNFIPSARNHRPSNRSRGKRASISWPSFRNLGRSRFSKLLSIAISFAITSFYCYEEKLVRLLIILLIL